jgi:hypothetical protein
MVFHTRPYGGAVAPATCTSHRTWAAYAASGCGALFVAVSLYWAAGGTALLDTVGGFAVQASRSSGAAGIAIIWAAVVLKAAGAVIPLWFVRPWGAVIPRRWRTAIAAAAAAVLTLYGAVEVTGEALAELGAVHPAGPVDWLALRWHLALWDPWFLLWGLLLAVATWQFARQHDSHARRPMTATRAAPPPPPGNRASAAPWCANPDSDDV